MNKYKKVLFQCCLGICWVFLIEAFSIALFLYRSLSVGQPTSVSFSGIYCQVFYRELLNIVLSSVLLGLIGGILRAWRFGFLKKNIH